jgi:RimJ/RimL family protein N-acetyltransferase
LRSCVRADAPRLFQWRNDPKIIALSAGQREVSWTEHTAWFNAALENPDVALFIVLADDQAVGTVRLERPEPTAATLTVFLQPRFTGKGVGPEAIKQATRHAFEDWPDLKLVRAYIRRTNTTSLRAFEKAGFAVPSVKTSPGTEEPLVEACYFETQPEQD